MANAGVVVDTDITIDFLRGHGEGAPVLRGLLRDGRALFTVITAFELHQGARRPEDAAAVAQLTDGRTLGLSLSAARRAGEIGRALATAGTPIGPADTLIAGICLHHDLPLATGNRRHFERIPGLTLQT